MNRQPNFRRLGVITLLGLLGIAAALVVVSPQTPWNRTGKNTFQQSLATVDGTIDSLELNHVIRSAKLEQSLLHHQLLVVRAERLRADDPDEYQLDGMTLTRSNITAFVLFWEKRIETQEEEIEAEATQHQAALSTLYDQRDAILQEEGLEPGTCEIHGDKLNRVRISIEYGFPSSPEIWNEAYGPASKSFPHSDQSVQGGEPNSSENPAFLPRLVCPSCSVARRNWLRENRGA